MRVRTGLLAVLLGWLLTGHAPAQAPATTPPAPPADTGVSAYQKVIHSTVWVHSARGKGRLATGSGSLVDRGRRLVLTNYHVVGNVPRATVFFPAFEGRKAIPERRYYQDRAGRLGIPGDVIEIDKQADLALIRLDRVPEGVPALRLATESPDPGQSVHSIGNPGRSGALWVYTPGKVRQVYSKRWQAKLNDTTSLWFQARVIETDSPTNPGDSGGPLANDAGELVGVTQGGAVDAQSLSTFVDLSEVKRLINRRSVQTLRSEAAPSATVAEVKADNRDAPLKSKDEGKFFGEEAWKTAQAAAERLHKEKKTDLLIETFQTPPGGDAAKLKALPAAERAKFFREVALDRVREEKVNGVYILISRSPSSLYVEIPANGPISTELGPKIHQALLDSFKQKKFDEGLTKAVQLILDAKGLGDKK